MIKNSLPLMTVDVVFLDDLVLLFIYNVPFDMPDCIACSCVCFFLYIVLVMEGVVSV
jgi:hypothetical protein